MGLLTFAGRIVLVVINIVFILVSLTLIIAGFVIRFANDYLKTYAKTIFDTIQSSVSSLNGGTSDFSSDNFELGTVLSKVAIALIVVGVVLLAFSIVGCCGACCNISTIMLVYSIVLIALLLAQVILVILVFGVPNVIKKKLKTEMLYGIDEYAGLKGTTLISLVWNWAMQQFDCCGADSYNDFTGSTWQTNDGGSRITPLACCKALPSDNSTANACAGGGTYVTLNAIKDLSNYDKGCVDQVWSQIMANKRWFGIVIGFCFAAQLVLIVFACLVFKDRGISGGLV